MKKCLVILLCFLLMLTSGCGASDNKGYKAEDTSLKEKIFEISDFSEIKLGMTHEEVNKLLGRPTYTTGSGISKYVYKLSEDFCIIFTYYGNDDLLLEIEIEAFGEEFVSRETKLFESGLNNK